MQQNQPTPQPKPDPKHPSPASKAAAPPPSPQPPAPPVSAPGTPSPASPRTRRRALVLLGVTAAVLIAGSITLLAMARGEKPRLSSDTETLAKFVATGEYRRLPFGERVGYMQVLEARDDNDELKDLFNAGRINEAQYRAAMDEAWLAQQYKRSQKYATLPTAPLRASYVRELLDKKLEKDARKEARKAARAASGKEKKDEPSDSVKRDESSEETLVAEWPAEAKAKWEQFRAAYRAEKESRGQAKPASDGSSGAGAAE